MATEIIVVVPSEIMTMDNAFRVVFQEKSDWLDCVALGGAWNMLEGYVERGWGKRRL
jgi:hypothetical protein